MDTLQMSVLASDSQVLFTEVMPVELPAGVEPLYARTNGKELQAPMSIFDKQRLVLEG